MLVGGSIFASTHWLTDANLVELHPYASENDLQTVKIEKTLFRHEWILLSL